MRLLVHFLRELLSVSSKQRFLQGSKNLHGVMKHKPTICSLNVTYECLHLYVCRIHTADCGKLDITRGKETTTTTKTTAVL